MLEKRKRRVKLIILTVICIVLAGVSVAEGFLYLQEEITIIYSCRKRRLNKNIKQLRVR